jgi:hypothetical protein
LAFVCTIDDDVGDLVIDLHESNSTLYRLGYDQNEAVNYFLMTGLESAPAWEFEFYFRLLRVHRHGPTDDIWDGREVATFMAREDRAKVRRLLLAVAGSLVSTLKPHTFVMTTRHHLPPKALEKYYDLCRAFIGHGYRVREMDPYHGQRAWRMERFPSNVIA